MVFGLRGGEVGAETASHRLRDRLAGAAVLIASVVQALMERGDNARYGAPVQPLVALVVLVTVWDLLSRPGHAGAAAALTP